MERKESYRERAEKRRIRFGNMHLGAFRCSGFAGGYDFPYIAYHESFAADCLEITSIIAVVIGMGLMYVLLGSEKNSLSDYCLFALGIFAVNRAFALSARAVNNASVKKRIASDVDYARIFAVKYPEQAHICRALNEIYAANPDAVPEEVIRARIAAKETANSRTARKIGYVLFVFFLLLSAALTVFLIWAFCETTE